MFNRIHQKLGTAGFIISIVALVAALGGGAYAASGGLTGKQKKEVEKIAKKYAGKPGAAGSTGPAGTSGGKGDTGATGAAGTSGANGTTGTEGKQGKEGSPWTLGGVVPSGKSEVGTWAVGPVGTSGVAALRTPISFAIPVQGPVLVSFLKPGDASTANCPGTVEEPEAAPGNLCVYQVAGFESELQGFQNPENAETSSGTPEEQEDNEFSAGRSGVFLIFGLESAAATVRGNWVVTAP